MQPEQTQRKRTVLRVAGPDGRSFLQGLITNDVAELDNGAVYAALLTPQGKYLSDFFLIPEGEDILVDLASDQVAAVVQKLSLYKLRAKVTIEETDLSVERGLGPTPDGAFTDPRHEGLGWRRYGVGIGESPEVAADIEAARVALMVPESGVELVPGDTYILEVGLDRLNGVNFKKGCYVGQEIVARMKHKLELRKGLRKVSVSEPVPVGTEIVAEGLSAGTLYTQVGGEGLAFLRFDRMKPAMTAGAATVSVQDPA